MNENELMLINDLGQQQWSPAGLLIHQASGQITFYLLYFI